MTTAEARPAADAGMAAKPQRDHSRGASHDLASVPLMLTVGEAAEVLRISRSSAYKLVQDWEASAGRSGLPAVRLGSRLLVRRVDLARIVGVEAA